MTALRAALIWVSIVPLAIANGALRERLLVPRMSELRAQQVSCLSAATIILLVALAGVRWVGASSTRGLLGIGAMWLALTVGFEFGFGRLVVGKPWTGLLADYNLGAGRLWPLVLLTTLISPWVAARLRWIGRG